MSGEPEPAERYRQAMRPYWHPVARSADVAEPPVGIRLLGEQIVLARLGGAVVAMEDLCRHFGAALSVGEIIDGCRLRCAYHGWAYDASGRCIDIPTRRGGTIPTDARVKAYPTQEASGLVWVCLDPAGLPLSREAGEGVGGRGPHGVPELVDPRFRFGEIRTYAPWRASVARVLMGALDDTHFPWVHPGLLGDREQPEAPNHRAIKQPDRVVSEYTVRQPRPHAAGVAAAETSPADDLVSYTNTVTANTIHLVKRGAGGTYVIWLACCPVDWDQTITFWRIGRDFDLDPAHDDQYERFEDVVREQDRPIVQSQRPWLLPPLASRLSLYIRPADAPLIAYQEWLEERGIPQV